MKTDLVVFGEDWGGLPSSTQHLMRHLAGERRILWVNSIGLRQPRPSLADARRALAKLSARATRTAVSRPHTERMTMPDGFRVLNPLTLPAPVSRPARALASSLLRRQLLPAIREAGLDRPVLWCSLPTAVDVAGQLGERATVYYCGDDFSALAGVDHDTVATRERELEAKADLILAASDTLHARFPATKTRLLAHGVDYPLFANPVPAASDLPDNGRPLAGFYGSLSEWLDLELLVDVARRLPHWDFVFIGAAHVDVSRLDRLDNVYRLGPRPHYELPGYSQHWDVSLLPFRDNAQIRACNPLKLTEYLAAGKPVVGTDFPALRRFEPLVSVCPDADSMVRAIEMSLEQAHDPEHQSRLRQAVANDSWQARARQVSAWLEDL